MKQTILRIIAVLLALASFAIVLYPFISNYLMSLNQESEIVAYDEHVRNMEDDLLESARKDAEDYNQSLYGDVMITDPFDPNYQPVFDKAYDSVLNLDGTGIMGYVEIPVISVNLPIYHGNTPGALEYGTSHLPNTSMPVGGVGTHCVITGHTGISTARLFTDLNQMKEGDIILIHVLGEKLAYQVDQIVVVLPSETDPLRIDPREDLVTLVTCTPYGINSHRLFVRGKRVPYEEVEEQLKLAAAEPAESTWMVEYRNAVIAGFVLLVLLLLVFSLVRRLLRNREKRRAALTEEQGQEEQNDN